MSSVFLGDDFLLTTDVARELFHDVAAPAPIVDLHNHLSAADIAADRVYANLTELWLEDDHYKWRALRLAGVDEQLVTGEADPWERFEAWAGTVPGLIRNPLHLWTHLELRRVFGIDLVLGPATAREIWEEANRQLPALSARGLLDRFQVRALATTDDPADELTSHSALRGETGPAVLPTFRPDAAHALLAEPTAWRWWAEQLERAAGTTVSDLDSLLAALAAAHARFAAVGGRASDHGLACLPDSDRDPALAASGVARVLAGEAATPAERDAVTLEVLLGTARLDVAVDGVLQLHLGPLRNVSPRLLRLAGRDAGADAMGDAGQAAGLARFLGGLERDGALPRTVLHNQNPRDNALFAALAGSFARPGVPGLVQWGPPWWFNDHEQGLRRQLDDLSAIGRLAACTGMVTDSRSLLSMTRHELFRRVLCDALGQDVATGRIPHDLELLRGLVYDVCIGNAVRFFGLDPELAG